MRNLKRATVLLGACLIALIIASGTYVFRSVIISKRATPHTTTPSDPVSATMAQYTQFGSAWLDQPKVQSFL